MQKHRQLTEEITDINLLTEQECLEVRSILHDLKQFWVKRLPSLPFYTLGTASWLDAENSSSIYYEKARRYNPILREHFGWLYERLVNTLEKQLKAPVCYRETLGLPGFHIFLAPPNSDLLDIDFPHMDVQYEFLKWEPSEEIEFSQPISFTLPIALPKSGGGLWIWDLHYDEMAGISEEKMRQRIHSMKKNFPAHYHAYEVGRLALSSGLYVHQAAPGRNLQLDDERITLQGHGIFYQGTWQLYW